MKAVVVKVRTNRVGSTTFRAFWVENDATPEEIEEMAWECALEMIDYTYEVIE